MAAVSSTTTVRLNPAAGCLTTDSKSKPKVTTPASTHSNLTVMATINIQVSPKPPPGISTTTDFTEVGCLHQLENVALREEIVRLSNRVQELLKEISSLKSAAQSTAATTLPVNEQKSMPRTLPAATAAPITSTLTAATPMTPIVSAPISTASGMTAVNHQKGDPHASVVIAAPRVDPQPTVSKQPHLASSVSTSQSTSTSTAASATAAGGPAPKTGDGLAASCHITGDPSASRLLLGERDDT